MQVGFRLSQGVLDDVLPFARQLGVDGIVVDCSDPPGGGIWGYEALLGLRRRVEATGLCLAGIQSMPEHYYHEIRCGLPGRDEKIERLCQVVRDLGRAGIPILGYHFNVQGFAYRTEFTPTGRGGARVTKYDHAQVANAPPSDIGQLRDADVWANLTYFLEAVVPVAEEAGVVLALHPDDPPMPSIAGVALVLRSVEAYKKASEIMPSPSNAVKFCQGTIAEMCETPAQVYEAIRYFASRGKIAYVHFRNVRGTVPKFEETFIDEGKVDMLEAVRAYHESGFEGLLIVDHTPLLVGDTQWGHRGRAYAIGYIKALIACVEAGSA